MHQPLRRLRHLLDRAGLPWTDVALAAAFVILAVAWSASTGHQDVPGPLEMHPRPLGVPILPTGAERAGGEVQDAPDFAWLVNVVAAAALAIRRRLPYTAFIVAVGTILVVQEGLEWPGFGAILICAFSAVAYGRSVAWAAMLLGAGAIAAASLFSNSIPEIPGSLGPFAVLAPAGLAAAALRSARSRADAAARRAEMLEQQQAANARAAIAEERARIARELHDIVGHHVSVMVIQAGAAGKVIGDRPDLARGALAAIESSGREAMADLRQLLGLMTPADDLLHPQPGLGDLENLVDTVRAAGQPVTFDRVVEALPPGADLTVYRVVQEGLTNALRYAPGAATTVRIRHDGDDLVVEVSNAAPTGTAPEGSAAGRGIIGLRERVRLHSGTLAAYRSPGGGFRLIARISTAPVGVS